MRTGRFLAALVLATNEHETLVRWAHRATAAQVTAPRARITLANETGRSNTAVAQHEHVRPPTGGK